jgi:hypothetical protein
LAMQQLDPGEHESRSSEPRGGCQLATAERPDRRRE